MQSSVPCWEQRSMEAGAWISEDEDGASDDRMELADGSPSHARPHASCLVGRG
jgi:hypothetical protein